MEEGKEIKRKLRKRKRRLMKGLKLKCGTDVSNVNELVYNSLEEVVIRWERQAGKRN